MNQRIIDEAMIISVYSFWRSSKTEGDHYSNPSVAPSENENNVTMIIDYICYRTLEVLTSMPFPSARKVERGPCSLRRRISSLRHVLQKTRTCTNDKSPRNVDGHSCGQIRIEGNHWRLRIDKGRMKIISDLATHDYSKHSSGSRNEGVPRSARVGGENLRGDGVKHAIHYLFIRLESPRRGHKHSYVTEENVATVPPEQLHRASGGCAREKKGSS